jgi:Na+/H+ antiporter NhaC
VRDDSLESAVLEWDGGLTLVAPIVAIGTALATRKVVPSLLAGVFVAAIVAREGALAPLGAGELGCLRGGEGCEEAGFVAAMISYVLEAVLDWDNLTITSFTLFVAAMVGVMSVTGATRTLVAGVERFARGPRGAMLSSWLGGLVVFFDDYANCMVVGNAMGPVCDRNGVSRAKLAYIVDSTAAPVASLTLVSTWVGYEVGLIEDALASVGRAGEGFSLFVTALPFRFYGIFALALVGILAWTGKDFGPMLAEEREARKQASSDSFGEPPSWSQVLVAGSPVIVLVVVTFGLMLQGGISALETPLVEAPLYEVLSGADPFLSMLIGAACGWGLASAIGLSRGELDLGSWFQGTRSGAHNVLEALVILYLAWSLGNAIGDTEAKTFLVSVLDGRLAASWLPAVTFLLASVTAFSTGTSFGTMSILIPLVVPLAATMTGTTPAILAGSTAAVLAGACLGDHASPISDTTVLSAAGCGADLVTHVRTQLPYALLAGAVSVLVGYVPVALGLSVWLAIPIGIATLFGVVQAVGQEA